MAEVDGDLIYEVLKAMQQRLTNLEEQAIANNTQLAAVREHMRGFSAELNGTRMDVANIYSGISRLERRVARIETRLDIVEEPAE
jgi:hypothetical protein